MSTDRRSFSQRNLETRQEGSLGPLLLEALHVPSASGYLLTHGFHPYPGRFHPHLARTLLRGLPAAAGLALPGTRVLDAFMGGGTTLVEAQLAGLPSIGNDLNPIAGIVARERTRPRSPAQAQEVQSESRRIAGQVEALRREKSRPRVQLPGIYRLTPHYAPHLLAELMQWIRLVSELPNGPVRETLRAVFSSAVVKFSNQAADSTPEERKSPTIAKGAPSRFLVQKAEELVQAQVDLGRLLGVNPPSVRLLEEDARLLPSLGWGEADLALMSPPYPGTYDYYLQHRLRMDWLGLDGQGLLDAELGPRRAQRVELGKRSQVHEGKSNPKSLSGVHEKQGEAASQRHAPKGKPGFRQAPAASGTAAPTARARRPVAEPVEPPTQQTAREQELPRSLSSDWRDTLVTLARVLKPEGTAFLVIGDWMDSGHAVDGCAVLTRAAESKGWRVASSASIRRAPHSPAERQAFKRRGKWEHLIYLVRAQSEPAA
jgi:hypothetical protein